MNLARFGRLGFLATVLGFVVYGGIPTATADVLNGNFENGLANWETFGITKTSGTATVGTASALIDAVFCAAENISCTDGAAGLSFMGVSFESFRELDALHHRYSYNGSSIKQSFFVEKNARLRFDYRTLTNEGVPSIWGDYTLFSLDGAPTFLGDTFVDSGFDSGVSGFAFANNWASFGQVIHRGWHTISFGAFQAGDANVATALLVDNVSVTAIPEPTTASLMLLAILTLASGGTGRFSRRNATSRLKP